MQLSLARRAEQWVHTLSRVFSWLGVAVLLAMTFVTTGDVIGRYGFQSPLVGSIDIIELMMVVLVFPCIAYCASQDGHVRVDVVYVKLGPRSRASLDTITSALSVFISGLITWQLGARALDIYLKPPGPATGYFLWPHLPFIALAAVGFALLSLELLTWFVHSVYDAVSSKSPALALEQ